jgi:hypothetical protein
VKDLRMSLTLLARRVLRRFPFLAPRIMHWMPGASLKPLTFAELAKRRADAGVPIRSSCSCAACHHARAYTAHATSGGD